MNKVMRHLRLLFFFCVLFLLTGLTSDAAKISQLPASDGTVADTDEMVINDYSVSPSTRRIDASQLRSYMGITLESKSAVNGFFADPSTNTGWNSSAWLIDLGLSSIDASVIDLTDVYNWTGEHTFGSGIAIAQAEQIYFDTDKDTFITGAGTDDTIGFSVGAEYVAELNATGFFLLDSFGGPAFSVNHNTEIVTSIYSIQTDQDIALFNGAGVFFGFDENTGFWESAPDVLSFKFNDVTVLDLTATSAANLDALGGNDGSNLTDLNGTEITSGTVAEARIDAAIARDSEVTAAVAVESASRLSADNSRAYAGGVAFDGVTGTASVNKPALTGPHTIYLKPEFNTLTEFFGTNTASNYAFGTLEYRFFFSGGNLVVRLYDGANYNQATYASSAFITTGKPIAITLHNPASGTAPTVYVDGAALAAPTTSVSGTAPGWDKVLIGDYYAYGQSFGSAAARLDGILHETALFNRGLSSAEILELSQIGVGAWLAKHSENKWGREDVITGGDFANPPDWSLTGSTITGGELVLPSPESASTIGNRATQSIAPLAFNQRALVRFDVTAFSGSDIAVFVQGTNLGAAGLMINRANMNVSEVGSYEVEIIANATGARNSFTISATGAEAGSVTIDNIQLIPLGTLAAYKMDEGIGRQLRDLSGRFDALLSATGYEHLQPKTEGFVRVAGIDANPAIYMLEAGDIIPTDSVITDIIAEERLVAVANTAQDLADNRIRLNPSGSDLQIQRSDGTNHTTLGTITAPTSLDDIDAQIHFKQIIR